MNTLVVVDIQKEYTTKGRLFFIESISESLRNAKSMLDSARKKGWKIVHVRHIQDGQIFSKDNMFSDFVPGFEPLDNEIEINKQNFSCFSNKEFENVLSRDSDIYIIGYGSTMCCLSTIVEGYHRGFNMNFIEDASRAKKSEFDEESTHRYAVDLLKTFCKVHKTKDIIG